MDASLEALDCRYAYGLLIDCVGACRNGLLLPAGTQIDLIFIHLYPIAQDGNGNGTLVVV